jgi:hypothetical protein
MKTQDCTGYRSRRKAGGVGKGTLIIMNKSEVREIGKRQTREEVEYICRWKSMRFVPSRGRVVDDPHHSSPTP